MVRFENIISEKVLTDNKDLIVPHIMSMNYFNILKLKIRGERLNKTQEYYYTHFIKKKLSAAAHIFGINTVFINGEEHMLKEKIEQAKKILKKIQRTHRNNKILISGSFLYKKKHQDIDVFVITKYDKKDYKQGDLHINYLPEDAKDGIFLASLNEISVSNFFFEKKMDYKINIDDLISVYQELIVYVVQKNDFKQELRDFLITSSYLSEKTVLNTKQLDFLVSRIIKQENPCMTINNILIKTLTILFDKKLKNNLLDMIKNNEELKKEIKAVENLRIYNDAYRRVLELEI